MQLHFGHRTPVHDIHHIEADILPSPIHRTFPCQTEVQHEHEFLKENVRLLLSREAVLVMNHISK